MGYDAEFFADYKKYLREPRVRRSHDRAFNWFNDNCPHASVVDFGCGLGEFYRFARPHWYIGFDQMVRDVDFPSAELDYLRDDWQKYLFFTPNVFVSLFSVEAFLPVSERYAFYAKTFRENPTITCGLVSGFFYRDRRDQETVGESGGIVSYQTREAPGDHPCEGFEEQWLVLGTPSTMFGESVVEVWKLFFRMPR